MLRQRKGAINLALTLFDQGVGADDETITSILAPEWSTDKMIELFEENVHKKTSVIAKNAMPVFKVPLPVSSLPKKKTMQVRTILNSDTISVPRMLSPIPLYKPNLRKVKYVSIMVNFYRVSVSGTSVSMSLIYQLMT